MVGKLNILKEKQHKTQNTKNKNKQKQENLTHLWDLKKIITHLWSWKTNKQTNKNKTTRRQKLDPTPMSLEIKIMMCA